MILFAIIMAYLILGTFISRHLYAAQLSNVRNQNIASMLEDAKTKRDSIVHGYDCWKSASYDRNNHDCDCVKKPVWVNLNRRVKALEKGNIPGSIRNPYITLVGWPVLGYDSFLRSGKVREINKANEAYIKQLESALDMPELQEQGGESN